MLSHSEAKKIVDEFAPTSGASLLVRAIGWLESNYGSKSASPSAHNWGNITTSSEPYFTMKDGLPGSEEFRKFKVYESHADGAKAILSLLERRYPEAIPAAEVDDWYGVAYAMKHGVDGFSYYETSVDNYYKGLLNALYSIENHIKKSGSIGGYLVVGAALSGIMLFKKKRKR